VRGTDPNTGEGTYQIPTRVDWHVPNESITGFKMVLYGRDQFDQWHLLAGADQQSGEIYPPDIEVNNDRNSIAIDDDEGKTLGTGDGTLRYTDPETDSSGRLIVIGELKPFVVALPHLEPELEENYLPTNQLPANSRFAIRP
jgi:hypothetical protein